MDKEAQSEGGSHTFVSSSPGVLQESLSDHQRKVPVHIQWRTERKLF